MIQKVCRKCRKIVQGVEDSPIDENLLTFLYWCFVIPGIIYKSTKSGVLSCGECGSYELVPLDSRVARKILKIKSNKVDDPTYKDSLINITDRTRRETMNMIYEGSPVEIPQNEESSFKKLYNKLKQLLHKN